MVALHDSKDGEAGSESKEDTEDDTACVTLADWLKGTQLMLRTDTVLGREDHVEEQVLLAEDEGESDGDGSPCEHAQGEEAVETVDLLKHLD